MTTSVKKGIKITHVNNTGKENYSSDCKMLYAYKWAQKFLKQRIKILLYQSG